MQLLESLLDLKFEKNGKLKDAKQITISLQWAKGEGTADLILDQRLHALYVDFVG